MRYISVFVEANNDVFEMGKNIFFFNNDFSSARLVVSVELETDEGTDDFVLTIIETFKHEDLSILNVTQAISGYKSYPESVLFGVRHDTFDCFTVVGPHSVSVSWCSCNFFKRFFRGKTESSVV